MQNLFPAEYNMTSSHRTRHKNEMQYQFAYANYVNEGREINFAHSNWELYYYLLKAKFKNGTRKYATIRIDYFYNERDSHVNLLNDRRRNRNKLNYILSHQDKIKFTCLNDNIEHDKSCALTAKNEIITDFYEVLFPTRSNFENEIVIQTPITELSCQMPLHSSPSLVYAIFFIITICLLFKNKRQIGTKFSSMRKRFVFQVYEPL